MTEAKETLALLSDTEVDMNSVSTNSRGSSEEPYVLLDAEDLELEP